MFMSGVLVLVGRVLLVGGAEYLVRGAVAIAGKLKVPTLMIGLTIVAFGTTIPEFTVSVQSALHGNEGISLGNIIGSNIANILLVLAISALIYPISYKAKMFYRDFSFLSITTLLFAFFCARGELVRWNGWVMLLFLFWFVFFSLYNSRHDPRSGDKIPKKFVGKSWANILLVTIGGFVAVAYGTDFLVDGAVEIAKFMGVPEAVIGVTIVAVGTSLPELATACVAAYRHQNGIALGNVMGSNILNVLFIMGTTVAMTNVKVASQFIFLDIWVMLFATFMLLPIMMFKHKITRMEAFFMLCCYGLYLYALTLISLGDWIVS